MPASSILPRRARPDRGSVLASVAVAGLLVAGFVLLRLAFATSVGGFVVASDRFVDPAAVPGGLPVVHGTGGYDGQFVYRFALDPWTAQAAEHGIRLDTPAYRQQRIATPVLAWALAWLPGVSTALALILVNAGALVVAAWYASRLVAAAGRPAWWGLVVAFPAGMPISLGRDLTEPVAWAGVLAGLWYARRGRWPAAAVALTVAVLARETSLLVVAGLAAAELGRAVRSRFRPAALPGEDEPAASPGWLALPIAVGACWQILLWQVWDALPVRSAGAGNLGGPPVLGVLESLLADLPDFRSAAIDNPLVGAVVFAERFALLALFGLAGYLLLRRRGSAEPVPAAAGAAPAAGRAAPAGDGTAPVADGGGPVAGGGGPDSGGGAAVVGAGRVTAGETVAWLLAVAVALSLRTWSTDVQFLRAANEAVGLSLLVAAGDTGRAGWLARWLGVALVGVVALEYAVRQ